METQKTWKHTKVARSKHSKQQIVESLKAAAAILAVDVVVVRRAKEMGCPAFRPGNRIDVDALRQWIADHSEELKSAPLSLKDQKLNEEIRKLKIANDVKEKELIRRSLVIEAHAKMAESVRKLLEQKLVNEYHVIVAGLDPAQARVYGKRLYDQIILEFKAFAKAWAI